MKVSDDVLTAALTGALGPVAAVHRSPAPQASTAALEYLLV